MHYLLTALGSYGDVHPMVGLGVTLSRRGHRVSVIANPYFADVVQDGGLELLSIGTREEYLKLAQHPRLWHPLGGMSLLLRRAVVDLLPQLFQLVEANYLPGETVVVAHPLDAASRVLRETHGAKVATAVYAPMALASTYDPPALGLPTFGPGMPRWVNALQLALGDRLVLGPLLKRPLNEFRQQRGLAPISRLMPDWWYRSDLTLGLFPDWFSPPQADWPRPLAAVGFPLWDGGEGVALAEEVEEFLGAGSPPIVFAPGSANTQAAEFFQVAVEVCRRLDHRGVLLSRFPEQIPTNLPPTVAHFPFVPLSRLLPRTAAMVHHGGIGTSAQALASGIPQLVRPMAFDQFDNAYRLRRLGVAEELRPAKFSPQSAAGLLQRLLESPQVSESCREWAARCDPDNARSQACDRLEALGH